MTHRKTHRRRTHRNRHSRKIRGGVFDMMTQSQLSKIPKQLLNSILGPSRTRHTNTRTRTVHEPYPESTPQVYTGYISPIPKNASRSRRRTHHRR